MKISVTDFLVPIGASVFKFCVHLPSGRLSVFSPMKISVADFLVPIGASVFKFCVHLQVG